MIYRHINVLCLQNVRVARSATITCYLCSESVDVTSGNGQGQGSIG
jgi:hypothetical protein